MHSGAQAVHSESPQGPPAGGPAGNGSKHFRAGLPRVGRRTGWKCRLVGMRTDGVRPPLEMLLVLRGHSSMTLRFPGRFRPRRARKPGAVRQWGRSGGARPTGDRAGACPAGLTSVRATLLGLALLGGLAGCSRPASQGNTEKLKTAQQKEDFELTRLATNPYSVDTVESAVKPGHWTSSAIDGVANNFDFRGELVSRPENLPGVAFQLGASRPVALPKAQPKTMELTFYVPPAAGSTRVGIDLVAPGGSVVEQSSFPLQRLPAHQFYAVVLAAQPERFQYLRGLDCFVPESGDVVDPLSSAHYRVLLPRVDKQTPVSSSALTWTNTAVLVWDEFDPSRLTTQQQTALLDWLHWGGQWVISGPGSLDLLRGTAFAPYLPAEGRGTWQLTADELAPLAALAAAGDRAPWQPKQPWAGEQLEPRLDAQVMLAHQGRPLLVERRAGRGRVVVSAFRLSQRELLAFSGLDGFWNGWLLRRPARQFRRYAGTITWRWADHPAISSFEMPERISRVAYFTRDEPRVREGNETVAPPQGAEDEEFAIAPDDTGPGVAGWTDAGPTAQAVRRSLQVASGIKIPQAGFVVRMLGIYLLLLVPVNWLVFRLLGRLEWAWAMVPVLALGFALAVARLAQLDIGFIRAENEIAVLEMQAGYARAHVTRFTSLYSSLSTQYDLAFSDPSALAQPFALQEFLLPGQTRTAMYFRRDRRVRLEGFQVASNSLGLMHSEHLWELDGPLELSAEGDLVANHTQLDLRGVGIVGPRGTAWIGALPAGSRREVKFSPWPSAPAEAPDPAVGLWAEHRDTDPATAAVTSPEVISVRQLLELGETSRPDDETRLVAWTDQPIEGLSIAPQAAQRRHVAVVVAHLAWEPAATPVADVNSRIQLGIPRRPQPTEDGPDAHGEAPAGDASPEMAPGDAAASDGAPSGAAASDSTPGGAATGAPATGASATPGGDPPAPVEGASEPSTSEPSTSEPAASPEGGGG